MMTQKRIEKIFKEMGEFCDNNKIVMSVFNGEILFNPKRCEFNSSFIDLLLSILDCENYTIFLNSESKLVCNVW